MAYIVLKNLDRNSIEFFQKNFDTHRLKDKNGYVIKNSDSIITLIKSQQEEISQYQQSLISFLFFKQRERQILEYMVDNPPFCTFHSIYSAIFKSQSLKSNNPSMVGRSVKNLCSMNLIVKKERGVYQITKMGEKFIRLIKSLEYDKSNELEEDF